MFCMESENKAIIIIKILCTCVLYADITDNKISRLLESKCLGLNHSVFPLCQNAPLNRIMFAGW